MTENFASTEQFWDNMLSGEPELIRSAYLSIDQDSQMAVHNHLLDMAAGEGWQPAQRRSARAALEALNENP